MWTPELFLYGFHAFSFTIVSKCLIKFRAHSTHSYIAPTWTYRLQTVNLVCGNGRPKIEYEVRSSCGCNHAFPIRFLQMFVRKTYDNDNLLAAQSCCFDLVRISGYESVTWFEFLSDPLELNYVHMTRASV